MKTFSFKNLWVRLAIIVIISSLTAVLPLAFYSYGQYEKIEICKTESYGGKMLSSLANISHLAYTKGAKAKKAEVHRFSNELIATSKKIASKGGKNVSTGRSAKMLYSHSAIESFVKNPMSAELVSEVASHISQQSGLLLDENMNTHILMDVASALFPKLYSDIFKLSEILSKNPTQIEKMQMQILVARCVAIEQDVREISNGLRKACALYDSKKTMAIIGNITKLNSSFAEFNTAMSKLWQGKTFENKQAEVALNSIESVSNNLWNSTNTLLAESLNSKADSILLNVKIVYGTFGGIFLFAIIVAILVVRSIVLTAYRTAKIAEMMSASKFAQARELAERLPRKIEPFFSMAENYLRICDTIESLQKSSSEIIASVEKLNGEAVDVASYQKPLVASVSNGLVRIDSKIAVRDKSDATLASSSQSIRDKLGSLEQNVRLQSKSVADVSSEITQVSELASKLIASLSVIRETANKMSLIAETFTAIADKANILGLNLAIETAKAGIKGSGLGTLAEQIKVLSKRTVISVVDIESIRDMIVETIDKGSDDAKKFLSSLESDSKILEEINKGLAELTASLSKVSSASNTISVSLRERGTSDMSLQDAQENLAKIEESLARFAGFAKSTEQELMRLRQR
ncbi:MAG: methyl-accepting chemotaxis protein [Opitutales bacterium]|nr:methyl-accepting chemotaxis protein [Opitutales bacterium]